MSHKNIYQVDSQYSLDGQSSGKLIKCLEKLLISLNWASLKDLYNKALEIINERQHLQEGDFAEVFQVVFTQLLHKLQQKQTSDIDKVSRTQYEQLENILQKLQSENRNHIRVEQQLKLFSDDLEDKIQEMTKKIKELEKLINSYQMVIKEKEIQIKSWKHKLQAADAKIFQITKENKQQLKLSHNQSKERSLQRQSLRMQAYTNKISKSRQLIMKARQKPKLFKDSITVKQYKEQHQSLSIKKQSEYNNLQMKKRYHNNSYHESNSRVGHSVKQLYTSIQLKQTENPKKRKLKYLTQSCEKKQFRKLY